MKNKTVPKAAFDKKTVSSKKWKDPMLGAMPAIDGKLPLSWRFSHCDKDGPFGWNLSSADIYEVMQKLPEFETRNWDGLLAARCHPIPFAQLEKAARDRLEKIELNDIDELMTFHLSGAKRIWCVQDGSLMRVLWWDPRHEVYKTEKDREDRKKRKLRSR